MNLIEKLCGYEKALQFLKSEKNSLEIDPVFYLDGQEILVDVLDDALLEYRRQHNIFEVEDAMVIPSRGNGIFHFNALFSDSDIAEARHATDAEIKAGKRLESLKETV